MTKQLLFGALLGTLVACQQDDSIQPDPTTLAAEVGGVYRTNAFINPSCVAIPTDQMPTVTLLPESDSVVALLYAYQVPVKGAKQIGGIRLIRQADSSVQLRSGNFALGSVQTDRVFTNNGMEKQGKLLRITQPDSPLELPYFAGVKE